MLIFLHPVVVAFFATFISAEDFDTHTHEPALDTVVPTIDTHMIEHEPALDTVVSTEHLLFQADVSHHLECAATCMRYAGCVAFSTAPMDPTPKLTCRGHDSKVFSQSSMVAASGSKTYYVESNPKASTWLERTCSVNSDCPSTVPNVVCYAQAGQCLCQPGYYYSHTNDTCVADCAAHNLQPTFLWYPKTRIPGHNMGKVDNCWLPEVGRQACLNDLRCRTFDRNTVDCATHNLQPTFLEYPKTRIPDHNKGRIAKCWLPEVGRQACVNDLRCRTFDWIRKPFRTICLKQEVTALSPGVEATTDAKSYHYQRTCL